MRFRSAPEQRGSSKVCSYRSQLSEESKKSWGDVGDKVNQPTVSLSWPRLVPRVRPNSRLRQPVESQRRLSSGVGVEFAANLPLDVVSSQWLLATGRNTALENPTPTAWPTAPRRLTELVA